MVWRTSARPLVSSCIWGVFFEKRMGFVEFDASVEAEQVVAHYLILIDRAGVDAVAAHAVESFPEVAGPAFTAHFAVGHYLESGFDFPCR